MTAERKGVHPIFCLLLLAALASILLFKPNVKFTQHARVSHPDAVTQIDNCFNGNGTISPTFRLDNNRWGQYCNDGSQNNYWRIFECRDGDRLVITQFKQALKKLNNYVRNHQMVAEETKC